MQGDKCLKCIGNSFADSHDKYIKLHFKRSTGVVKVIIWKQVRVGLCCTANFLTSQKQISCWGDPIYATLEYVTVERKYLKKALKVMFFVF